MTIQKISYGQTLLRQYLNLALPFIVQENFRPDYMEGLEFDFYYPDYNLAFEFNGDQHYFKTGFGGPIKQKCNDAKKYRLCKQHNITLVSLEAIDLEYTKLSGKILRLGIFNTKKFRANIKLVKDGLGKFNASATQYRKTLITSYDSPTARKHGSEVRKTAIANTNLSEIVLLTETDYKVIRKKTITENHIERKIQNKIRKNEKLLLDLIEEIFVVQ